MGVYLRGKYLPFAINAARNNRCFMKSYLVSFLREIQITRKPYFVDHIYVESVSHLAYGS